MQASYQEVYDMAAHKWRTEGHVAASSYLHDMVAGTTGEQRGMILALLADYVAFGATPQHYSDALAHYAEALELLVEPDARFQVLAWAMGVCADCRSTKKGLRFAIACDGIMSIHKDLPARTLAFYYLNDGRLTLQSQEYEDAANAFEMAARNFRATPNATEDDEQRALYSEVCLAEALMELRRYDEAVDVCSNVRRNAKSHRVISYLNIVEGKIALRLGDVAKANRLAMRAIETTVEKLGDKDGRYLVMLISLVSDIVERENPAMASDILKFLIRKVSSFATK